jgi:hypothetical protein
MLKWQQKNPILWFNGYLTILPVSVKVLFQASINKWIFPSVILAIFAIIRPFLKPLKKIFTLMSDSSPTQRIDDDALKFG